MASIIDDKNPKQPSKTEGLSTSPSTSLTRDIHIPIEESSLSNSAKWGAYLTVLFAGFALLSDGYQNGIVSFVDSLFSRIYPKEYTTEISTRIANAALVGQIIGQIFFGLVVDRIGRKTGLIACTILVVVGAALAAGSTGGKGGDLNGLFWMLTVTRGVLGVGVGCVSPVSRCLCLLCTANAHCDWNF